MTNPIIVYVGSFDPFHLGHLEALTITRELYPGCPTIILPNNPCKTKPHRRPLLYRAHALSFMFPLFTDFTWLNSAEISVDTRPADTVLSKLCGNIIGIIGSDILVRHPKWLPNRWIIFERNGYPVNLPLTFYGVQYTIVPLAHTRYQYISSTAIRTSGDASLLPHIMRERGAIDYTLKCNFQTLNQKVTHHHIEETAFVKTCIDSDFVALYCNKSALWNSITNNPFVSATVLKIDGMNIHESLILNCRPILDVLTDNNVRKFFDYLSTLHRVMRDCQTYILHGDMSVMNILVLDDGRLAVIDYDKVRECAAEELVRDYNQFLSSIRFYSQRYGLEYDMDHWNHIGEEIYLTKDIL